jgi:hypothetical protein
MAGGTAFAAIDRLRRSDPERCGDDALARRLHRATLTTHGLRSGRRDLHFPASAHSVDRGGIRQLWSEDRVALQIHRHSGAIAHAIAIDSRPVAAVAAAGISQVELQMRM